MTTQHDPARLLAEMMRPIIRDEIRAAVSELLAEREEAPAEWLDTKGAAKILGVHVKTLERLSRSGEIKSARAGRCLRFSRAVVDAYLERGAS